VSFGVEAYRDEVDSFSSQNAIQGPVADDATYDTLGVYLQDRIPMGERLEWTLGARYNRAAAESDRVSDPVSGTPISVDEDWDQVIGSARFLYRLDPDTWHLFGGVSQGFRAPNLSDLTRFDSARTNEFEVPSPDLDPEEFLTFELGLHARTERARLEASVFYTDIRDLIVRFPTGNTNALGEFEITKDNVGDGWVYGFELGGALEVVTDWTVFGDLTFLEGRQDTYPTSAQQEEEEWLDRLMPLTVRLGLRWEHSDTWAEALTIFADDADKLSTRDQSDTQRIPPGGTPDYAVLHLGVGRRINDHVRVRAGVDNVFDEDYRVHGSGSNMPGRNVIVGASLSF
jgi:hemoglobin/transferrin/lactoferrin receptor protein